MYFWNINKLKEELKKGPLPEKDAFKYYFVTIVLYGIMMSMGLQYGDFTFLNMCLYALVTGYGIYYSYQCNGGAEGSNFIQKDIALSWVLGIRWTFLVYLPLVIVYMVIKYLVYGVQTDAYTFTDIVFYNLLIVPFYWKLGANVKYTVGK